MAPELASFSKAIFHSLQFHKDRYGNRKQMVNEMWSQFLRTPKLSGSYFAEEQHWSTGHVIFACTFSCPYSSSPSSILKTKNGNHPEKFESARGPNDLYEEETTGSRTNVINTNDLYTTILLMISTESTQNPTGHPLYAHRHTYANITLILNGRRKM